MKKVIVGFVAIIMVVLLVSCASYTCPTYAKYSPDKKVKIRHR